MDPKHSLEPWEFAPGRYNAQPVPGSPGIIMAADGWVVATVEGAVPDCDPPDAIDREAVETAEANARRIAACVNACRGLDTDYLEAIARIPDDAGRLMALSQLAMADASVGAAD